MIDDMTEFVVTYLQSRNVQNWSWVGYKQFKALIMYITAIKDIDMLRTIFEKILNLGYFIKRKIYSKTEYRFVFNPATSSTIIEGEEMLSTKRC
jgi:hypothetical protein